MGEAHHADLHAVLLAVRPEDQLVRDLAGGIEDVGAQRGVLVNRVPLPFPVVDAKRAGEDDAAHAGQPGGFGNRDRSSDGDVEGVIGAHLSQHPDLRRRVEYEFRLVLPHGVNQRGKIPDVARHHRHLSRHAVDVAGIRGNVEQ